jgi:bla regulator protein blaR1
MGITQLIALTTSVATVTILAQTAGGPTFDVVSIKRNTSGALGSTGSGDRPDGGFRMLNAPLTLLIGRAYPPSIPADMVGLPDWAMRDHYDVIATSPLQKATPDERIAMLRAMLADRLKLAVHTESREHEVYELVVAHTDGRLGPNLKPSEIDCVAKLAADQAAGVPRPLMTPEFIMRGTGTVPPCVFWTSGDHVEGDNTMAAFAFWVRIATRGRDVVDKTGLAGSYRLKMDFDSREAMRGPDASPAADRPPSIFTALPDQLGLKLEKAKLMRDTLVVDHLERPTEN